MMVWASRPPALENAGRTRGLEKTGETPAPQEKPVTQESDAASSEAAFAQSAREKEKVLWSTRRSAIRRVAFTGSASPTLASPQPNLATADPHYKKSP